MPACTPRKLSPYLSLDPSIAIAIVIAILIALVLVTVIASGRDASGIFEIIL